MNDERDPWSESGTSQRPLWQWVLLGIAPGLVADFLASLLLIPTLARSPLAAAMVFNLFTPLVVLGYVIWLSGKYAADRPMFRKGERVRFAVAMLALNLLLWGTSCFMQVSNMDFH